MNGVPLEHALLVAIILFVIGLCGVLARRNVLFVLVSLEIMFNAAGLAFIIGGFRWYQPDGQIMFIFVITMAAAEVAIGLALVLLYHRLRSTLDLDRADEMKG